MAWREKKKGREKEKGISLARGLVGQIKSRRLAARYINQSIVGEASVFFLFSFFFLNNQRATFPRRHFDVARFTRKLANLRYKREGKVRLRPQNRSQPTGTRFRGNPFNIIFNLALNRLAVSASEAEKLAAEPTQKPCFCAQTGGSLVGNIPELGESSTCSMTKIM